MTIRLLIMIVVSILVTACADRYTEISTSPMTISPTIERTVITPSPKPTSTALSTQSPIKLPLLESNGNDLPTFSSTPTWSPTLTPIPTPYAPPVSTLEAHTWLPENRLVIVDSHGGDGCCQYPRPPELILYSNGQLYIYHSQAGQLLTKKLIREEICAFLNTIDQLGFFDYDPATYLIDPYGRQIDSYAIEGSSTQHISVKAWRSNSMSLYGLWSFIEDEETYVDWPKNRPYQPPTILPSLSSTFLFLSSYLPDGLQIYKPEALEVWITGSAYSADSAKIWPIEEPSLEYLVENAQPDDRYGSSVITIEGVSAHKVFEVFAQSLQPQVYSDGKNMAELYVMPLLPDEIESPNSPTPTPFGLSCTPSDGQITWSP